MSIVKKLAHEDAIKGAKYYKGGYKEAYKDYYNGYKHGDLDQGNSFASYIKSNPKAKQKYNSLAAQFRRENFRVNPQNRIAYEEQQRKRR